MELKSLQDLLVEDLKDIYNAEAQIIRALPRMAKAASNEQLKQAFEEHLDQTKDQVERLKDVFELFGKPARGKSCKAMQGIIEEGKEVMKNGAEPEVLDAALIGSAQKVEHYEIAAYGTARTYAQMLGNEDAAEILQDILDEEGETDKKLTKLAESFVNEQAKQSQ